MAKPQNTQVRLTLRSMRLLLVVASVLVLVIGTPIFFAPTTSDTLFSWTVNPELTAAFLGAGYLGSFLLEFVSSRQRIWARARVAVPSVFVFTTVMLGVTLLHIDKFHLSSDANVVAQAVAWVWLVVYSVVPVILIVLTVAQLRAPGVDPPRVAPLPRIAFVAMIVQAVVLVSVGIGLLVAPDPVADAVWPWGLSALTARAIGAFLLGTGVVAAHSVWENDLVRLPGALAAYCAFGFLETFVILRFANSTHAETGEALVNWGDGRAWAYVVFFLSLGLVGLFGLVRARRFRGSDALQSASG